MGGNQRPLRFFLTSLLPVLRTSCSQASGIRRRARGDGYEGRDGVTESERDYMMRELGDVVNEIQTRAVCVVKTEERLVRQRRRCGLGRVHDSPRERQVQVRVAPRVAAGGVSSRSAAEVRTCLLTRQREGRR